MPVVATEIQALILKLSNPNRVFEAIPTAKPFNIRDTTLVVTPHRLDEVRILRNLGITVPSPILYYYGWPGPFKPYEHQRQTAAFLTLHQYGLVLNEIGTGKTHAALWAADYLITCKQIKKVLIMSKLSTLERVWGDTMFMLFPHRKFVILHGTAKRRLELMQQDVDFYVINHDGFGIIADKTKGMFDLMVIDEAAAFRNPKTQRFKILNKWVKANPQTRLWLLTGTPTPNAPTDAWVLAQLVKNPVCPKGYTTFREQVMMKIGQWQWVPRPNAIDITQAVLQPSIRYTRDECFELPDTVEQTRRAELSTEQEQHYKRMLKHLVTEVTEGTIIAVNEAIKMQKLVQIACGVAYTEDGQTVELDCKNRINIVKEVIEEAGEKILVFVPLTGVLHMLERELSKHWTCAVVNGAVPASKRNKIFQDFQHSESPHVIIAHPATMAHGLTLTSASTIIWYGPVTSNEQYAQANGRVERLGKKYTSNIVHIEATDLERRMYQRLKTKQKMQGLLLDYIQQQTNR